MKWNKVTRRWNTCTVKQNDNIFEVNLVSFVYSPKTQICIRKLYSENNMQHLLFFVFPQVVFVVQWWSDLYSLIQVCCHNLTLKTGQRLDFTPHFFHWNHGRKQSLNSYNGCEVYLHPFFKYVCSCDCCFKTDLKTM